MGTKSRTDADGAGNKAGTARGRAQPATGKAREGKRRQPQTAGGEDDNTGGSDRLGQ